MCQWGQLHKCLPLRDGVTIVYPALLCGFTSVCKPILDRALVTWHNVLQLWEEDPELFSHSMETDDPLRSRAESLLLTLLEVGHRHRQHPAWSRYSECNLCVWMAPTHVCCVLLLSLINTSPSSHETIKLLSDLQTDRRQVGAACRVTGSF